MGGLSHSKEFDAASNLKVVSPLTLWDGDGRVGSDHHRYGVEIEKRKSTESYAEKKHVPAECHRPTYLRDPSVIAA